MKIGKATYCNVICAFAGAEAILCFTLTPPPVNTLIIK